MSEYVTTNWQDEVRRLNPCGDAMIWLSRRLDAATAWRECPRGDWMLWLLGRCSGPPESESRRRLVLAACDCADLALPFARGVNAGEAVRVARGWAMQDGTTLEQVRDAAAADAAAAAAAYAYAANAAADAAAAYAAYAAAAARIKALSRCADIVRKHYPNPPVKNERCR